MNRRIIIATAVVAVLGVTAPAWANTNTPSGNSEHCEEARVEHASGATGSCATPTTSSTTSTTITTVIVHPPVVITIPPTTGVPRPAPPVCRFDTRYDAGSFECDMAEVLSRISTTAVDAPPATPTPALPRFPG